MYIYVRTHTYVNKPKERKKNKFIQNYVPEEAKKEDVDYISV